MVQLQPQRRSLCGVEQLRAGGCDGEYGGRPVEVAEGRPGGPEPFDADRGLRAYSAVDGVREVGLGDEGWGAGAGNVEAVWVGDGVERTYSSGGAEGGGQCGLPYGDGDGVSAACAGSCAESGADDGSGGQAGGRAG